LGVTVDEFKADVITVSPDGVRRGSVAVNVVTISITEADMMPLSVPKRFLEAAVMLSAVNTFIPGRLYEHLPGSSIN